MKSKRCTWQEEHAYDYIRDHMDEKRRNRYGAHLATCKLCQTYVSEWEQILQARDEEARPSIALKVRLHEAWVETYRELDWKQGKERVSQAYMLAQGADDMPTAERENVRALNNEVEAGKRQGSDVAGERAEHDNEQHMPVSEKVIHMPSHSSVEQKEYAQMTKDAVTNGESGKRAGFLTKASRHLAVIGGVAVIVLAFATYIFAWQTNHGTFVKEANRGERDIAEMVGGNGERSYFVTQQDEKRKPQLMNDPATSRFHITPVRADYEVDGAVYVNDVTNELFMHVKGLAPVVEKDYQLWFVHDDEKINSELLEIEDKQAILYYKGDEVGDVVLLRVSLERKGGSEKPQGPNTFFVDLTR